MNRRTCVFLVAGVLAISAGLTAGQEASMTDWYEFKPAEDVGESVIGMESWLDAPAGKRGGVRVVGDRFELADGTPIKFWGVNLGSGDNAPPKETGTKWAAFHAKYGVNCVRMHKFVGVGGGSIGDRNDSTKYDAEALDNFDHLVNEARQRGMYYGWSWVFEHSVRPDDRARLKAYDELVAAGGETHRLAVFIAEDVQDLRIEMLVNLLKHQNPYTGLTYAKDPALAFVELHNEDSIFFYTFSRLNDPKVLPTYRKAFFERYSRWLKDKYGSHEGLVKAWGENGLNALDTKDEHLDQLNIQVEGNPWMASPEGLATARSRGIERRVLDNAAFLHHVQGTFYRRFAAAIRDAGYDGPLVGSCWATPAGVPQYLNLHNDWEIGFIDRHAYFGGSTGKNTWKPDPGPIDNSAQVDDPGKGMISSGLLQTIDRPFAMSEWTSVIPNEWLLEGPAIFAAYGMGLQGWDASYHFASHTREYGGRMFASRLNDPRVWVVDLPNQLGLYPALARMVLRGDVTEGPVISNRRVSVGELIDGGPEWLSKEKIAQSWDIKEYSGAVPGAALAAGRVVVEFVDEPAASDFPDMSGYVKDGVIRSATGQLAWTPRSGEKRGYFTLDTPGTAAAVGFLPGEPMKVGGTTFECQTPFAGLFLTALGKDQTLDTADRLLLVAMARAGNTGQTFNADRTELIEMGTGPILLEPVRANVRVGREVKDVWLLDHDGRRTDRTIPVQDGVLRIDGAKDKTFYYELVMR